jgi:tRNA (guanosine-2'-O-)-methyltransferase
MTDAELLRPLLLAERAARLDAVIAARLRGVTAVLERVRDEGNASAVLRTCEALGVQDVHVIEAPEARFRIVGPITQGCERWLDIHRAQDPKACFAALRAQGFRIYGSFLAGAAVPLGELDFRSPAALVFGNEQTGITPEARAACDALFVIPMRGMTRSFNISVAAAIALEHATTARRAALGSAGDLTPDAQSALRDRWYRAEVRDVEAVLARLRS